jgi:hypothetical protein
MYRFQYSVCTNASRSLAWEVFSDWHRWSSFANIYGELRWQEGQPWEIGSRMQIEVLRPARTMVDHLIISCSPGQEVGWIDRGFGITLGQWVRFEEIGTLQTRVKTWGEIAPSGVLVAGSPIEQIVGQFTETWYENFRSECDRLNQAAQSAPSLEQGSLSPLPAAGEAPGGEIGKKERSRLALNPQQRLRGAVAAAYRSLHSCWPAGICPITCEE